MHMRTGGVLAHGGHQEALALLSRMDPEFVAMFLDEAAMLAAQMTPQRRRDALDVAQEGELFLVMEYVHGMSLSALMRFRARHRSRFRAWYRCGRHRRYALRSRGAHEATTEAGQAPGDRPPGRLSADDPRQSGRQRPRPRLRDRQGRPVASMQVRHGTAKFGGKLAYMSSEQLAREPFDRRSDVYATAVVLWEGPHRGSGSSISRRPWRSSRRSARTRSTRRRRRGRTCRR